MKKSFKKSEMHQSSGLYNKTIKELKYLFEFASPEALKKSILEVFLSYLCNTQSEDYSPKLPKISEDFYFLIRFLEAAYKDRKKVF
jgi:hypothetical protein